MKSVVLNAIENKGKDNRNFVELLNNQRRATTINNLLGNDIKDILENSKDIQKDLSNLIENFGKDLGLNLDIEYASNETMPEISKTSSGSAFINKETKRATIVINVDKINSTSEYVGTLFEELSHIIDGIAGRQDEKVAKDKTNDEEGLESLGRPINEYFKEEYSKEIDNLDKKDEIKLNPTKDLSNVNLGDKYGDVGVGFSESFSGSYIGSVSMGGTTFAIANEDFSKYEYAKTLDLEIGFGTPTIAAGGSIVILFNVYKSKDLETGKSYVIGGSLNAAGGDLILDEDFKVIGFKFSLSKSNNLPKYAFKNILTKAEGHTRISTSTVREAKEMSNKERIEDNLKNIQKLYDKKERKINDMGEFIKTINQLKEEIENLGDVYER